MFSLQHMQRQFATGRFDLLLKSVVHNGMDLPPELQDHLQSHPVCCTALAVKRALEISYGRPDAKTAKMVDFLLDAQEENGSFGFMPLPTACVYAAISQIIKVAPEGSLPILKPQALYRVQAKTQKALKQMIKDQATHGLAQSSPGNMPLLDQSESSDWAFILMLLSDDLTWQDHAPTEQLHQWFAVNQSQLPQETIKIWRRSCWQSTPAPGNFPGSSHGGSPRHQDRISKNLWKSPRDVSKRRHETSSEHANRNAPHARCRNHMTDHATTVARPVSPDANVSTPVANQHATGHRNQLPNTPHANQTLFHGRRDMA